MKNLSSDHRPVRAWAVGLFATVLIAGPSPLRAQGIPADAKPTCTVSAPLFASWFESGSPSLNGVVNPANSITFSNVPNCSFYQWSKQMFLWLTSPAPATYGGGGGRILDSPTFYDVSPPDASGNRTFIQHTPGFIRGLNVRTAQVGPHGLPVILDTAGRLLEVATPTEEPTRKIQILNSAGKLVNLQNVTLGRTGEPVLLDEEGKTIATAAIAEPKAVEPKAVTTKPTATTKPVLINPILNRPVLTASATVLPVQKFIINRIPIFIDPSGNVIDVEQGQAGTGAVLETQKGSLIYYATMVNDVYAYFLTGAKDGGITPMPSQFPTTQQDLNKIIAFASAHGKTFPDPDALAIEVKSSWVEASTIPNLANYITMQATIPTYDEANPNQWVPNGQKTVQLAMVGIHVVGSTIGHPEMVWATFEHMSSAPDDAYSYITNANVTKTVPRNTAGTWLFTASGAGAPFNVMRMMQSGLDIVPVPPNSIGPSNIIRWKAWGGPSNTSPNPLDASAAASNTEIISIDNSVGSQMPAGDVRSNYFMTGSTWTINGASPTGSFPAGNEVGTSMLSNSTMETFDQGTDSTSATGSNCFSCHFSNTTTVSHVFGGLKPLF